jgi:XisH protein
MPAKDIYHDAVKNALIKDGWTIQPILIQLNMKMRNYMQI